MTLENCEKQLEHYEKLSRGEGIHERYKIEVRNQIIANAKKNAENMRSHIESKKKRIKAELVGGNPLYLKYAERFAEKEEVKESKSKGKK
jgi:hypothetical protein